MSPDISALGNLTAAEPLDLEMYPDAQERGTGTKFQLPPAGRYVVRAPDSFPDTAFGKTKAGFLSARIDPTIVGPSHEGFQLRYIDVSAKTFERDGKPASWVGDYLRATGDHTPLSGDPKQTAEAIALTAGKGYELELDWKAFIKSEGREVKGMENFPQLADGTYQSWLPDPVAKDERGQPARVWARLKVTRFIPAAA